MGVVMKQYINLINEIVSKGVVKGDRTGTGTLSLFSPSQFECDLRDGFPLLTTKKMFFRGISEELLWFLSGSGNIKPLVDSGVKIWDGNGYDFYLKRFNRGDFGSNHLLLNQDDWKQAIKDSQDANPDIGDLGNIYGKQWRSFGGETDQVTNLIQSLKYNPESRRHILNAWNARDIEEGNMALPPCHVMYQFYVEGELLHMKMYQRSADVFLGVPFNIASCGLLLTLIAREVGLTPARLIIDYGDAHIYTNHLEQIGEQVSREPYPLARIEIAPGKSIYELTTSDITLTGYHSHGRLTGIMAV